MQTLEEKKALLQRAMDEGLEVRVDDRFTAEVLCVGNTDVFLRFDTDVEAGYSMDCFDYHIVEPRITADDLAEAIEKHKRGFKCGVADRELYDLARRYLEQEAGE